jgi:hypothetical protein
VVFIFKNAIAELRVVEERSKREVVGLEDGVPGMVMAINTFGEYPDKFHPHLHAIVTN